MMDNVYSNWFLFRSWVLLLILGVGTGVYAKDWKSLNDQALDAFEKENWQKGLELLESALVKNPFSLTLNFNLATFYHRIEQYDKASLYYGNIMKLRPDEYWVSLLQAQCFEKKQMFEEASKIYRLVVEKFPTVPEYQLLAGRFFARQEMLSESIPYFQTYFYLTDGEHNASLHQEFANLLSKDKGRAVESANHYLAAATSFERENNPTEAVKNFLKATDMFRNAQNVSEVEKIFSSLKDRYPNNIAISISRASFLVGEGKIQDARDVLMLLSEEQIEKLKDVILLRDYYKAMAIIYEDAKTFDLAGEYLVKLHRISGDPMIKCQLASIYAQISNHEKIVELLEDVNLNEVPYTCKERQADSLIALGKREEATFVLEKIVDYQGGISQAQDYLLYKLARAYIFGKDKSKATPLLEKLKNMPSYQERVGVYLTLSKSQEENNNVENRSPASIVIPTEGVKP